MNKYSSLILCVFLISSCTNHQEPNKNNFDNKKSAANQISASLRPGTDEQFKFGQLTESLLVLKNLTDKAMVIIQVYIGSDEDTIILTMQLQLNKVI